MSKDSGNNSMFFENHIAMPELLEMFHHQYSRRTVYSWISQGMPHKKVKRKLWFPKDEVCRWLERT